MFGLGSAEDARSLAIDAGSLTTVGRIAKVHGTRGGVVLVWHDSPSFTPPDLEAGDFAFIARDGLPVPYSVVEGTDRNDGTTIAYFSDIDTPEVARSLCGCDVLLLKSTLDAKVGDELDAAGLESFLAGRTLKDQAGDPVGTIRAVEAFSLNVLLMVETPDGRELMVPFHESLVLDFPSAPSEALQLTIPDGLNSL